MLWLLKLAIFKSHTEIYYGLRGRRRIMGRCKNKLEERNSKKEWGDRSAKSYLKKVR